MPALMRDVAVLLLAASLWAELPIQASARSVSNPASTIVSVQGSGLWPLADDADEHLAAFEALEVLPSSTASAYIPAASEVTLDDVLPGALPSTLGLEPTTALFVSQEDDSAGVWARTLKWGTRAALRHLTGLKEAPGKGKKGDAEDGGGDSTGGEIVDPVPPASPAVGGEDGPDDEDGTDGGDSTSGGGTQPPASSSPVPAPSPSPPATVVINPDTPTDAEQPAVPMEQQPSEVLPTALAEELSTQAGGAPSVDTVSVAFLLEGVSGGSLNTGLLSVAADVVARLSGTPNDSWRAIMRAASPPGSSSPPPPPPPSPRPPSPRPSPPPATSPTPPASPSPSPSPSSTPSPSPSPSPSPVPPASPTPPASPRPPASPAPPTSPAPPPNGTTKAGHAAGSGARRRLLQGLAGQALQPEVTLEILTQNPKLVVYRLTSQSSAGSSSGCKSELCVRLLAAGVPLLPASLRVAPSFEGLTGGVGSGVSLDDEAARVAENRRLGVIIGCSVGAGLLLLILLIARRRVVALLRSAVAVVRRGAAAAAAGGGHGRQRPGGAAATARATAAGSVASKDSSIPWIDAPLTIKGRVGRSGGSGMASPRTPDAMSAAAVLAAALPASPISSPLYTIDSEDPAPPMRLTPDQAALMALRTTPARRAGAQGAGSGSGSGGGTAGVAHSPLRRGGRHRHNAAESQQRARTQV